jgi:hypothetical protein
MENVCCFNVERPVSFQRRNSSEPEGVVIVFLIGTITIRSDTNIAYETDFSATAIAAMSRLDTDARSRFDFVRLATLADQMDVTFQALRYHAEKSGLLPMVREDGAVLVPRDFAMRCVAEEANFDSLTKLLTALDYSYTDE